MNKYYIFFKYINEIKSYKYQYLKSLAYDFDLLLLLLIAAKVFSF